jgi:hypothetical protein
LTSGKHLNTLPPDFKGIVLLARILLSGKDLKDVTNARYRGRLAGAAPARFDSLSETSTGAPDASP